VPRSQRTKRDASLHRQRRPPLRDGRQPTRRQHQLCGRRSRRRPPAHPQCTRPKRSRTTKDRRRRRANARARALPPPWARPAHHAPHAATVRAAAPPSAGVPMAALAAAQRAADAAPASYLLDRRPSRSSSIAPHSPVREGAVPGRTARLPRRRRRPSHSLKRSREVARREVARREVRRRTRSCRTRPVPAVQTSASPAERLDRRRRAHARAPPRRRTHAAASRAASRAAVRRSRRAASGARNLSRASRGRALRPAALQAHLG
jgi:hypothetical protein